ncbi:MAG: MFS transporter [Deltaproteobacteria bacterium]|nr:MFS transporter [Deltaproteobacteria bacterium]
MMISPAKGLFYLIEFINCYAAVYYSNFLFFYLRRTLGFGEVENLLTAALGGVVYMIASWQGGRYADRYGCIRMLYIGFAGVMASLVLGMLFSGSTAQVIIFCLWNMAVCLIWPSLEALISDRAGASLSKMVGIYNITWAAGGAVGYFTAGILLEKMGMASLFWFPLGLTVIELALLLFAAGRLKEEHDCQDLDAPEPSAFRPAEADRFLRMAWFANPFCYVAINTVIPLIPSIADKLALSTAVAGMVCSLWMFARLAAFAILWRWAGWHYRFRWLAAAFILMIVCFFGFLLAQSVWLLMAAEVGFGFSIGLVYYSSLYYSMHASEKQGSNAGLHEAMMGGGLFLGPAIGAAALYLAPAAAGIGAWSVGGLLCAGFSGLLFMSHYRIKS